MAESLATSPRKFMCVWRLSQGLIYTVSVAGHSAYLRYEAYWPRKPLQLEKELTALLESSINLFVIAAAPQSPNCPAKSPSACTVCWELKSSSTEQLIFWGLGFSKFFCVCFFGFFLFLYNSALKATCWALLWIYLPWWVNLIWGGIETQSWVLQYIS